MILEHKCKDLCRLMDLGKPSPFPSEAVVSHHIYRCVAFNSLNSLIEKLDFLISAIKNNIH